MFKLIAKDIIPNKKEVLVSLAGALVIVPILNVFLTMPNQTFHLGPVLVSFFISYLLLVALFQTDDRDKTDILVISLPVSRTEIVSARYLFLFLFIFLVCLLGLGAEYAAGRLFPGKFQIDVSENLLALAVPLIFAAISFPAYYKLGGIRAQRVVMGILFAIAILPAVLSNVFHVASAKVPDSVKTVVGASILWMCVLAAVLYIFSFILSVRFYREREF